MSESGPIGNGLNVRNSGTDELQAGRLRNGADSFVIEDGWIVAQTIHYTVEKE